MQFEVYGVDHKKSNGGVGWGGGGEIQKNHTRSSDLKECKH